MTEQHANSVTREKLLIGILRDGNQLPRIQMNADFNARSPRRARLDGIAGQTAQHRTADASGDGTVTPPDGAASCYAAQCGTRDRTTPVGAGWIVTGRTVSTTCACCAWDGVKVLAEVGVSQPASASEANSEPSNVPAKYRMTPPYNIDSLASAPVGRCCINRT